MSYTYTIEIKKSYGGYYWTVKRSDGTLFSARKNAPTEAAAKERAEAFVDGGCTAIYTPPEPLRYQYTPKPQTTPLETMPEPEPEPRQWWWRKQ